MPETDLSHGLLDFDALCDKYGVNDVTTGRDAAWAAREYFLDVARTVIESGAITMDHLIVAGIVSRAQAFHEGTIAAVEASNPHAAFTLLRAYAEQCAAVVYMTDHPEKAKRLWDDFEGRGVSTGKITSNVKNSGRIPDFGEVYDRLSKFAHPSSSAHFANMQVGEDRSFTWQSAPRFKREEDKLVAYLWCIEFARLINVFIFEFAAARGLGSWVPPNRCE